MRKVNRVEIWYDPDGLCIAFVRAGNSEVIYKNATYWSIERLKRVLDSYDAKIRLTTHFSKFMVHLIYYVVRGIEIS